MNSLFIGIDNGLSGGIVIIDSNQNILHKFVMPTIKTEGKRKYDTQRIIEILNVPEPVDTFVCLEEARVRPVSGKRACFTTGFGYGLIHGVLETLGLGYDIVTPQKWMKEFKLSSKEKKGSIEFCKKKWPDEDWRQTKRCKNAHDGMTDACCLAYFSLRKNR